MLTPRSPPYTGHVASLGAALRSRHQAYDGWRVPPVARPTLRLGETAAARVVLRSETATPTLMHYDARVVLSREVPT